MKSRWKKVEYKIISGKVVEIKRTYMPRAADVKKPRGHRIAGNSDERKIRDNEREQKKRLARTLNANLEKGWMLVTCKYDDVTRPADYAALRVAGQKFMRKVREAFRKEHGRSPRFIMVNANWNAVEDRPAKFHHHIVIESCSWDMLRSLWPVEHGISIEPIDGREDHTALAVYLIDNVHGLPSNGKVWSTSRDNLAKPIYTEPVEIVDSIADIKPIPTATQTAFERLDGEAGTPVSAYIRCVLPERPVIRGRQIILPKPPKRGGKKANEPI